MSTSVSPALSSHTHPTSRHRPRHTYHAHRRESFIATDIPEQVEIRARLRTFEGAYSRTALASLGYSVLVLKLFDRRFYRIGLLYVLLSLLLLLVQFQRRRHARHDFADKFRESGDTSTPTSPQQSNAVLQPTSVLGGAIQPEVYVSEGEQPQTSSHEPALPAITATATSIAHLGGGGGKVERVWGREFKTAGWSVVLVTLIVGAVEIALFGLVCAL